MKLTKYIPTFNLKGHVFYNIFTSRQAQIDKLYDNIEDLVNQCFISSATWGIIYWEQELGLKIDETDTLENRRARCLAQIRGTGNCTPEHIKFVAKSFGYGDIDVIEDFEHYRFTIKFTSTKGIPPKMEDFKATIRTISPAHLGIYYEFTYITWDEFDSYNKSWNEWDALNLAWDEFEKYKE